jgi:hypothetical protein
MIQGLRFSTVIGSGCVHYWHIPWTIFASNKQQEAASSSKQQQALVKPAQQQPSSQTRAGIKSVSTKQPSNQASKHPSSQAPIHVLV